MDHGLLDNSVSLTVSISVFESGLNGFDVARKPVYI